MGNHENGNGNGVPFRLTLRELPLPVRLVLSLFLMAVALGYFSALVQLHFQNASPGEPLPTADDVVEIFSGVEHFWSGKPPAAEPLKPVSKLEKLIMAPETLPFNGSGSMAKAFFNKDLKKLTDKDPEAGAKMRQDREGERLALQAWINTPPEQRQEAYEKDALPMPEELAGRSITQKFVEGRNVKVRSILEARCYSCHETEGQQGKVALDTYESLDKYMELPKATKLADGTMVAKSSRQMSLEHLTQTTHLHLLTFCVLWMLTGLIFAFSSYPTWVRCILAPVVLLAQVADVSCWWLARLDGVGPYFALAIIGTGAVVGVGLLLQIALSLFNMYRLPGRLVLSVLLGAAIAGCVALEPIIDSRLASEKAPPPSAPTAPTK